jgi:hypothetical protein
MYIISSLALETMVRALLLCTTIVAAFPLPLAARAPNIEEAPVTPAIAALAARLGIDVVHDRARFVSEITRLLHAPGDGKHPPALLPSTRDDGSDSGAVRVPVPLAASLWSRAVFQRAVTADGLIAAILGDRRAALVAHGLAGLDDETLAFMSDHPALLAFLYESAPGAFAAFGDTLRVAGDRVIVPGGPAAAPLWEAVVRERVTSPERFARALFGNVEGRLAYLYGVVTSADAPAAAFTLGLWMSDETTRVQRFVALADACVAGYREWRVEALPYSRPLSDLAVMLLRMRLHPSGRPAEPAGRGFWADILEAAATAPGTPRLATGPEPLLIDAAWLVHAIGTGDMYSRGERLDQLAFGQRVFADLTDDLAAATAIKSFRQFRMLMLTMERMGIRSLPVYTTALRQAASVMAADGDRRFWTVAQYQGALALIARLRRVGSIDGATCEQLVMSAANVPVDGAGAYGGGMAEWIRTVLAPHLPTGRTWEERIITAMAGPSSERSAARLRWEGQAYRLDLAFAERRRLEVVRSKQGGHTVDLALSIAARARSLRVPALSVDAAHAAAAAIRAIAVEHDALLRRPPIVLLPPGVDAPRDGVEWMNKAADEAAKIGRQGDGRRLGRVATSLSDLADVVLGNALLGMAYAADIGEADGTALQGTNVALRHDFGFARRDATGRTRTPWAVPRQDFLPGVPWHITGSLLGLDIALAPLSLRRLSLDGLPSAPKLTSVEREAFAVSVSLMDPTRLTDGDRDAIVAAIARGQQRVGALITGSESAAAVAEALALDGRRVRALAWSMEHDPGNLTEQFSLAELLTLGGGAPDADLDAWGASGVYAWGCACTRFPPPRAWRVLGGRPQLPMMAATHTDLTLKIAMMLSEMHLPAAITRAVLASAMREFIDTAAPRDAHDWWSLARAAQRVRRQRVEDYVAAAAVVDGPLVPEGVVTTPQP